jgi:putative ABC transport system substrate-binding protein
VKRRDFIKLLGTAAAGLPAAVWAQQPAHPVVAFLRDTTAAGGDEFAAALRRGLAEAGFNEGHNVSIEQIYSDGHTDRLPELAADLVRRRVSLIVGSAIAATLAAKGATTTIPIVFAIANDPVAFGLVASLVRPGGNLTGVSYLTSELGGKRLGLLHELVPHVKEIALLVNPANPNNQISIRDVEAAARVIGVRHRIFDVTDQASIEAAFAAMADQRIGAALVGNDPLFTTFRQETVALALRYAVPAIYTAREYAEIGGLLSYGPSLPDVYRQAGVYAGRILKGEKPAELPVLLPITFEMVLNLKTAQALQIEIPPTFSARADGVIE